MTIPKSFAVLALYATLLSACAEEPSDPIPASQAPDATAPVEAAGKTADATPDDLAEAAQEDAAPGLVYRDAYTREARPPGYREPDVIYVPTPQPVVEAMLELAGVGPDDVLYDLGSGDGRIPITAARRFGIRAVGIDIEPVRIREANANARAAGVTDRVSFRQEDLFESDFSEATVVTLYLLPSLNRKLRPRLLAELEPGTRIVSHAFDMGDDWPPEQTRRIDSSVIHLWTVPER
ncbi:methyltransferase domain-containing protein [Luteimonas viscosa]|uniref:Methyltransferase domain-containing protein n=1 Tax=Luteimonas viscosa TaxID=1132694 RepID=A0A5D4XIL5_9GAMM|nr:class I SAM-dependent methyltransferase [Luteimonas viscosa]TYT23755.1 methyltransferase domain-containing protein [Luteimonas viscosa]